jgi:hypothetical protein
MGLGKSHGRRGRGWQIVGVAISLEAMTDELFADLLAAVEQQLTSPQTPYVGATLRRLVKLGVEESEAKSQIALCLGEEMDEVLRKRRAFDEKAYRAFLDALPHAGGDGID